MRYLDHWGTSLQGGFTVTRFLASIMPVILAGTLAITLMACPSRIVRDTVTYEVELNQYDSWATQQAALLKGFLVEHCTCDEDLKFTTPRCERSADFILTIEARAAWHKAMSRYNAGLEKQRPPKDPPEIPPNSVLCPLGAP